jgi:hypothetical protein
MISNGTIYLSDIIRGSSRMLDANLTAEDIPVLKVEVVPSPYSNASLLEFTWNATH